MEMKSISGLTCYVKDIAKTSEFYEALGFRFGNQEADTVTVYLNWFSIRFVAQAKDSKINNDNSGIFVSIKVDNVDEFYQGVIDKGLKPVSEPSNQSTGNREFVLNDPDGYQLVFFAKK